jgi:ribosomal protein L10
MTSTFRNTLIAAAIAVSGFTSLPALAAEPDTTALSAEAREVIGNFVKKLKGELSAALKNGGPTKAIEICKKAAPEIAKKASVDGWTVRRTSLKTRNPDNAPDSWEEKALTDFSDAMKNEGADPKKLQRAEITEVNGKKVFRFMKAIPTSAKPCLGCHGAEIKGEVKEKLAELYPKDKATGFKEGDLRGAFTLTKTLQ